MQVTEFPLDQHFNSLATPNPAELSPEQALEYFAKSQAMLHHRYYQSKPCRSTSELGTALFIMSLYLYKRGIPVGRLSTQELCELLRILSTDLYKVSLWDLGSWI